MFVLALALNHASTGTCTLQNDSFIISCFFQSIIFIILIFFRSTFRTLLDSSCLQFSLKLMLKSAYRQLLLRSCGGGSIGGGFASFLCLSRLSVRSCRVLNTSITFLSNIFVFFSPSALSVPTKNFTDYTIHKQRSFMIFFYESLKSLVNEESIKFTLVT